MLTVEVVQAGENVRPSAVREPIDSWTVPPLPPHGDGDDGERTLEELIVHAVGQHVDRLRLSAPPLPRRPMTGEAMEAGAEAGRVAWPKSSRGRRKPRFERAALRTLRSFLEGQFRVYVDGRPRTDLDESLPVTDTSRVVFLRTARLSLGSQPDAGSQAEAGPEPEAGDDAKA